MKKITLLLFCFMSFSGFAQSKSTGNIDLENGYTANFTLSSSPAEVTLVLTGPFDRWFALGFGSSVASGFRMSAGDVIVFNGAISDRFFRGTQAPGTDNLDWTGTNVVSGSIRTLTLKRTLTTAETTNDLQMPYATTNSINVAWARTAGGANDNGLDSNHDVGFASGTFTTLGVEDFSLNAASIYPNPASGEFFITAKTQLSKVNLYSQLGALIKTIDVADDSNQVQVNVAGIPSGVYLLELQNDAEKSWKKIIIN
jgi:hypothetical protein